MKICDFDTQEKQLARLLEKYERESLESELGSLPSSSTPVAGTDLRPSRGVSGVSSITRTIQEPSSLQTGEKSNVARVGNSEVTHEAPSDAPIQKPTGVRAGATPRTQGPDNIGRAHNAKSHEEVARRAPKNSPLEVEPYESFVLAYPDYSGSLSFFVKALYYVRGLRKDNNLASFLYDDVVRAFVEDYLPYVNNLPLSMPPLTLLAWYSRHTKILRYSRHVVTSENLDRFLDHYPELVAENDKILGTPNHSSRGSTSSATDSTSPPPSARHSEPVTAEKVEPEPAGDYDNEEDDGSHVGAADPGSPEPEPEPPRILPIARGGQNARDEGRVEIPQSVIRRRTRAYLATFVGGLNKQPSPQASPPKPSIKGKEVDRTGGYSAAVATRFSPSPRVSSRPVNKLVALPLGPSVGVKRKPSSELPAMANSTEKNQEGRQVKRMRRFIEWRLAKSNPWGDRG